MKNLFLILYGSLLLFISCSEKEFEEVVPIICTVDYIQFLNEDTAIVKFDTTVYGIKKSYLITENYTSDQGNFFIGDELVRIENFTSKDNEATFDFYYAANLGFFCNSLFEVVPLHTHDDFEAEAEKDNTGKTVGKWKIKRKKNITN